MLDKIPEPDSEKPRVPVIENNTSPVAQQPADLAQPQPPAPPPRRKISLEAIVGIVTAIVGIAAIVIAHWDANELKPTQAGKFEFADETVTLDGRVFKPPKGPIQVQFWTPSARTKEAQNIKDWERMDNDDKLDDFAAKLMKRKIVPGYRRYEVIGAGIGDRQIGAWWVSTGDFKFVEFLKLYQEFWKPGTDNVYMEIAPVAGGHSR